MDYNKFIKLHLPNGNFIKIQLLGNETDLKELLSAVTDISPSLIKGIKDSQGHYYTISSAWKSPHIWLSNEDHYYEIVFAKTKQTSVDIKSTKQQIIWNTTPNVGNYYANYYINEQQNERNKKSINMQDKAKPIHKHEKTEAHVIRNKVDKAVKAQIIEKQEPSKPWSNIETYNSIWQQIYKDKKITDVIYIECVKVLSPENKEICEQFEMFINHKITEHDLIDKLSTYANPFNEQSKPPTKSKPIISPDFSFANGCSNNSRLSFFNCDNKTKSVDSIISRLEERFNAEEIEMIKNWITFENKNAMNAISDYERDNDIDKWTAEMSRNWSKYKQKRSETLKMSCNLNWKRKTTNEPVKIIVNTEAVKQREEEGISKTNVRNDRNNNKSSYTTKVISHVQGDKIRHHYRKTSTMPYKSKTTISLSLLNSLNTIYRIMYNYVKINDKDMYKEIRKCVSVNDDNQVKEQKIVDKLIEFLDRKCTQLQLGNILEVKSDFIQAMNEQILKQNKDIIKIFQNFDVNNSFVTLFKDINEYLIKANRRGNTTKCTNTKIKDEARLHRVVESFDGGTNSNNLNGTITTFINELDTIGIKGAKKDKIILLIKTNDTALKDILSDYSNTKDIAIYKEKLIKWVKTKRMSSKVNKWDTTESPKKPQNHIKNVEELVKYLETEKLLSSSRIKYIKEEFAKSNKQLSILYNEYSNDLNLNKIICSIQTFAAKTFKKTTLSNTQIKHQDITKTPELIANSKNDLHFFWKSTEWKAKNIIEKKKKIVSLLYEEHWTGKTNYDFDSKCYNDIIKKIEEDDSNWVAAFEVYAVTKDHHEFFETMRMIAYLNDTGGWSQTHKSTWNYLLNSGNYSKEQRKVLLNELEKKNDFLIQTINLYQKVKDSEDALNSFDIILKHVDN